MRERYKLIFCLAGLLLASCEQVQTLVAQYQQPKEDPEMTQAQAVVEKLRRIALEDVARARILVNAHPYEQLFILSPQECVQLRNIIAHTEPVIPAKGSPQIIYVAYPSFETLVLLDKEGHEYDLPMLERLWMRKSVADTLSPERVRRSDEPYWCLPDADYEALQALPTLRQARMWAKLHARGTTLVMPNNPVPPPPATPEAEEPEAPAAAAVSAPANSAPPAAPALS